jgi:hypothetical protein
MPDESVKRDEHVIIDFDNSAREVATVPEELHGAVAHNQCIDRGINLAS